MTRSLHPVAARQPPREASFGAVAAATASAGALLLSRMRKEMLAAGRLTPMTTAAMYAGYSAHAAATGVALTRGAGRMPIPRPVVTLGAGLVPAGFALCVAGMSRFAGPGQVSGTDPAAVVVGGAYRLSRNPQYLGYLVALTGLGVARRSPTALGFAAMAAAVYRWWIPVEEAHLDVTFGQSYYSYRDRTPRWMGLPRF